MEPIIYLIVNWLPFLLFSGAIVSYYLSGSEDKKSTSGAIVILAIGLVVWLLANRNLPFSFALSAWAPGESTAQWLLVVDDINWQVSFYFLLLMEALLLTQSRSNLPRSTGAQTFGERLFMPLILVGSIVVLLTI